VRFRALAHVLAVQLPGHEIGGERVGDRNEVRARRVEGIEEGAGLAHEGPAPVGREDLLAGIGEVLELQEVLDLVTPAVERIAELGLVLTNPVQRPVQGVDSLEGVEAGVGDDPDRNRPRRERDQPHPVALSHQVGGAEMTDPPLAVDDAIEELLVVVVHPLFVVQAAGQPEPGGVHVVPVFLLQAELALERERPARRVHHPVGGDRPGVPVAAHGQLVCVVAEVHVLHATAVEEVHAGREVAPSQLVLEAAAVELVGGNRREERRSVLHPLREVAVVARGPEVAQRHLVQLLLLQVVLHPDHFGEVVRPGLDRRLADLESGLGRLTLTLLGGEDRRLRSSLL
jgi:hypothetical protein